MDLRMVRGFSPLSGDEIKKAICGSLFQELSKNTDFDSNIAWPVVKWRLHVEVEYAPNLQAEVKSSSTELNEERITTDKEGQPLAVDPISNFSGHLQHKVEYPDLTREQLIESPQVARQMPPIEADKGKQMVTATVGATPELLSPTLPEIIRRPRGRPRKQVG